MSASLACAGKAERDARIVLQASGVDLERRVTGMGTVGSEPRNNSHERFISELIGASRL